MHRPTKHRIHDPMFQIRTLDTAHGAVVFDADQQTAALKIGKRNDFPRQLFRP